MGIPAYERRRRRLELDLKWWFPLTKIYNNEAVIVGAPRHVPSSFWATNASTSWGMGGVFDGDYFAVSWKEGAAMEKEPGYPFQPDNELPGHINYLELFAVFWALKLWGSRLSGMIIPMWVDNTTALAMANKLKGTTVHIPLLRRILALCVRFNVRVQA
jgi:hypothetical protein